MENISFDSYIKSFEVFGQYSEEYGYQLEHLLSVGEYLKDDFSILDIGAGTGFFARDFLAKCRINASSYTAVEPSKEHVKELKENFNGFSLEIDIHGIILNSVSK